MEGLLKAVDEDKNLSGVLEHIDPKLLREDFTQMLLIRQFELRAENAYREGHIGGFFHSYIGQEAIQTAAIRAMGKQHWWSCSYRCHALALLLGVTPQELMSELYGKVTGNALGRGGSMHLYTERLMGGFGIVGGQIPIATGAALTIKRSRAPDCSQPFKEISVCFLGDGAVAQGAFHESLNLASLWDLPCLYVIENNEWGMGTAVDRAIAALPIAARQAPSYDMEAIEVDGMDYFSCFTAFKKAFETISRTSRPVLMEVKAQRFRGHSVSDPGTYRTKDDLDACKQRDPIDLLEKKLIDAKIITKNCREQITEAVTLQVKEALTFAENSPFPSSATLEEGVYCEPL